MKNELALIPTYWASVSGGKDSLYMLNMILHNLDKYPLNGVVHFELEIDYPFIKDVINYMESECIKHGIEFIRIKPVKTWEELYEKYGFPMRKARWCNSDYKLSCSSQFKNFMKSKGYNVFYYIGYCVDEVNRYKGRHLNEIYPLVDNNIIESYILNWAKTQDIFNNYYKTNARCGCMYCPMASRINFAYLYKYYPDNFNYMINKMRETEVKRGKELGRPFSCISSNPKYNADYLVRNIIEKWLPKLEEIERK